MKSRRKQKVMKSKLGRNIFHDTLSWRIIAGTILGQKIKLSGHTTA